MRKVCFIVAALFLLLISAGSSHALVLMIGDNDGYGYGNLVVPDGATLPYTANYYNWVFDNRSAAELSAVDGSQFTDWEPYGSRVFSFHFDPPAGSLSALFTMDVSGIQQGAFGLSRLYLDGVDFSYILPYNQGAWGSGLYSATVSASLLADGILNVQFIGGLYDHLAFDFFRLETVSAPVPEPGTMVLLGSGLVGLAGWGRKRLRK